MKKCLYKLLLLFSTSLTVFTALSDDTELYDYAIRVDFGIRPKVLIVFDNSGSMKTLEEGQRGYDPDITYGSVQGLNSFNSRYIYYTGQGIDQTSLPVPDSPSESRRFPDITNSCYTAKQALDTSGYYIGTMLEYRVNGQNKDTWQMMPDNDGSNLELIDCYDDILQGYAWNANDWQAAHRDWTGAAREGFPTNNDKDSPYKPIIDTDGNGLPDSGSYPALFTSATPVTLYTDNYLRWYHGGCPLNTATNQCDPNIPTNISKSRLDWAKEAVTNAITSVRGIDVGLMVFNINAFDEYARDGGRIVRKIDNYDIASEFNPVVNALQANTNTPLCETMYEAYRYLAGLSVLYGDDDGKPINRGKVQNNYNYNVNTPPRDTSAESQSIYQSPFDKCSNQVTVILVTDGAPTKDNAANSRIKSEFNISSPYTMKNGVQTYLPKLTEALAATDTDILPNESSFPGNQRVRTFVIGIGDITSDPTTVGMLTDAATGSTKANSSGYYNATDMSTGLEFALLDILYDTLTEKSSFTSPAVATNEFDRTRHLDALYFAMFQPTQVGQNMPWWGNLKKYKVNGDNVYDANNQIAFTQDTGDVKDTAKSFWSTHTDGRDVAKGGVLSHLQSRSSERNFLTDTGNGILSVNALTTADKSLIASAMGVSDAEVPDYISWVKGVDVDDDDGDDSTADKRQQLVGDILHSRPLAINYGGAENSQDVRILVGTNAGVMHMFKDNGDTVDESWAYLPYEFWPLQPTLRNYSGNRDYYGVDSSPVSHREGENTWVFFGVRRGGHQYYGLDISSPDSPSLMWKIDKTTPGFELLGQTWSEPVVTYVNHKNAGQGKPVLVFAGGYDTNKDADNVGSDDTIGRGVYIVNAETGALIWSVTSANYDGFKDSMPGKVGILDSDKDGLVDRLYVTDTGGHVFRIDMPTPDPSGDSLWTVHKLASLGGDAVAADRRFFYEPAIAQTVVDVKNTTTTISAEGQSVDVVVNQKIPFDAVLIGSGNRSHPLGTSTSDKFFMIQDRNIQTASITDADIAEQGGVIQLGDLFDVTSQPIHNQLTQEQHQAQLLAYGGKRGWLFNFTGVGEKSLSSAIVVSGVVYFTSYIPSTSSEAAAQCVASGVGRIYAVDLQYGYYTHLWHYLELNDPPDTPKIIFPPGEDSIGKIICAGCRPVCEAGVDCPTDPNAAQCSGDDCPSTPTAPSDFVDTKLSLMPDRIYYYLKEENNE